MIKMPDNVLAFSDQTKTATLFEQFADLWNHYMAKDFGKKVSYVEKDSEGNVLSFEDKSNRLHEAMKKEIARIAGVQDFSVVAPEVWVTSPTYKWATFAVIGAMIDMIIPDTLIDTIGLYSDIRTGGYGDNFAFDIEPNDLFYVTKSGRGVRHAEAQKSFNGQVVVTPIEHDVSVQVNLYRVLAGKENLAAFALKAVRSIETEMAYDAYTAFNTAVAAVPATAGYELAYTGYSQSNFVELASKVSAYNSGAKAIAFGTLIAVSQILPTDLNYRIQIDSDYVKIGYIPNFMNVDVLVLPQKADWKNPYSLVLDDTKIYMLSPASQKIVKVCLEGSTISVTDEQMGSANLTQQTTLKKMWGTGIATNATFGYIDLSE